MPASTSRSVRSLLAVDQQLGEVAALWVAPKLADPVGSIEVGKHKDVEQLGAWSGTGSSYGLTSAWGQGIRPRARRAARAPGAPSRRGGLPFQSGQERPTPRGIDPDTEESLV
jgi:hypothetical protein